MHEDFHTSFFLVNHLKDDHPSHRTCVKDCIWISTSIPPALPLSVFVARRIIFLDYDIPLVVTMDTTIGAENLLIRVVVLVDVC